jgi:hypothetical protein
VRAIARRLRRLENRTARITTVQLFGIQYSYLKTPPDDFTGPRHVVTVKQLPPVERAEDWFEWQERHGAEPLSPASPNDDLVVRVWYLARTPARNRYRYHGI